MRWSNLLEHFKRGRAVNRSKSPRSDFRRLLGEQLEDRRLLAVAVNDNYEIGIGHTLTVNGLGTWQNDSYNMESSMPNCEYGWEGVCYYHAAGEISSTPAHGTLNQISSGYNWQDWDENHELAGAGEYGLAFTYTPNPDFVGTDSFTYSIWDNLGSSQATVSIEVANHAPTSANDSYNVFSGASLTISAATGVLHNDGDPDGDPLTAALVPNSGPEHGTLTLNANGSFSYAAAAGYVGSDSFRYQAHDPYTASDEATVNITVNRQPPVASDDAPPSLNEDSSLTVEAPGVLENDDDRGTGTLTASLVAGPSFGNLTLNTDGSFIYTPQPNAFGTDTFTYRANNGVDNSNVATVTLTVNNVNDAPIGANDSATVRPNTATSNYFVNIPVLANDNDPDGDPLTPQTDGTPSPPSHGTTQIINGTIKYTPTAGYRGTDSFTYKVKDPSNAYSNVATVSVLVNSVPVANWDSPFTVLQDTVLTVPYSNRLLLNDTDLDGDLLTAVQYNGPFHGTLSAPGLNSDGTFTYTPAPGYAGWDFLSYRAFDGVSYSNVSTVSIKVNAAPVGVSDSYFLTEEDPEFISPWSVLANDTDANRDTLIAPSHTNPAHGTLNFHTDGTFAYTPQAGFPGNYSFTYRASDGSAQSADTTVWLHVLPVDGSIVAVADSYSTSQVQTLQVAAPGVLANDQGANGATVKLASGPAHGTLTLSTDGSFTYTPDMVYSGSDSFTYRVYGQSAASHLATVNIDVTEVDDVALVNFFSDGTDLQVEYLVLGASVQPFTISLFASSDGLALDDELQVTLVDSAAYLSPGMHTIPIPATFDDPAGDYYLLAQVDSGHTIDEEIEANNTALFAGGSFVVHEQQSGKTILHVQGTDQDEPISVSSMGLENSWQVIMHQQAAVAPSAWNGFPAYFDVSGDGLVTQLDADAVFYRLSYWPSPSYPALAWQWFNRFDVDRDGMETPLDALIVINELNLSGERLLTGHPSATDGWLDVSGDYLLSALDADQVIHYLTNGDADYNPPHRNPFSPWDTLDDGSFDYSDYYALLDCLAMTATTYYPLAVDEVHIRSHGGSDSVSVNDGQAIIYGGASDDTLSGGQFDDLIEGGDGVDTIFGNDGNDHVDGGNGYDSIWNGKGDKSNK